MTSRPDGGIHYPAVASLAVALGVAASAWAHSMSAAQVIAEVAGAEGRALGVVAAARDAKVPRLLVVRVGPAWTEAPGERRRDAAETWLAHWRMAVPGGMVGVIDAATGATLVNYDARGRARLTTPPAARPPSPGPP